MKDLPLEKEINLDSAALSNKKNVVKRFYKDLWDQQKVELIPILLHKDFTFRGSLGPVLHGHDEFRQYVMWLTDVLAGYTSDILDLVEEDDQVAGKLRFHGVQTKGFFGHEPSHEQLWWHGAPIFTFDGDRVKDLWVLGDIYGLKKRLEATNSEIEFSIG